MDNIMREKDLRETGLADMAFKVESDHEVQMARAELYKVAKYAIKMHEMLKGVEEREGLEGWVQSKITKAADYLSSVYHHMDYEMKFDEVTESKKNDKFEPHMMYKDGKSKKANTEKEHKDLAKKGWSHDNPKTKKVEEDIKNKEDYMAQKKAIQDIQMDPNTNKDEKLKKEVMRKKAELDDKAKKMGFKESYVETLEQKLEEAKKKKGLYYYVNKRKKAGTSRSKNHPDAPSEKDWDNAAKTAKESVEAKCPDCGNPSYTTLPEEKQKGVDGKVCWKGYKRMGTKKKGGKTVDNCVKM